MAETARCTGHCCRGFTIPYSPAQLQSALAATRARVPPAPGLKIPLDVEDIAPMAVPIEFVRPPADEGRPDYWRYRCKHLASNGDCTIYARRPDMCVRYPYGKACPFDGCTRRTDEPEPLVQLSA